MRKNERDIKKSFVVISDSLEHSPTSVNIFLIKVTERVKEMYPFISQVRAWSDGAPTQVMI